MYQTLLFDLDGTLTDPKEGITKCVQYALKHYGIEEELDNLIRFIGPPMQGAFMEYYGFDAKTATEAIEKYRERFRDIGIFENGVYEGIEALLGQLKSQGKVLAVATSKPFVFADRILEHYGLKPYFDVIVGSELDGRRGSKAEVIEEVFNQLNITDGNKETVVMIGDRKHDILGARSCGVDSIGVAFGYAEENELEAAGATYVVQSVGELSDLLLHR